LPRRTTTRFRPPLFLLGFADPSKHLVLRCHELHRWTTAGYVKRLLRPRQSRGTSFGGLGYRIDSCYVPASACRPRSVIVNQVTVIGRRPAYMIPDVAVVSPSSTKRPRVSTVKPCASMIASVRRAVIAGILNRQQRTTAYGHRFTANHVGDLRRNLTASAAVARAFGCFISPNSSKNEHRRA
jgi:hypothetical protein